MDSTNTSSIREEMFLLQKGKAYSLFMSENSYIRDSLMSIQPERIDAGSLQQLLGQMPKTAFTYRILKSVDNDKVYYYDKIVTKPFKYEESPSYNWNITGEKQIINGINCIVAEGSYAGRDYIAYFTTDIPLTDGPYKFGGLPGLIVKIQDRKGHYIFELLSYKNLPSDTRFLSLDRNFENGKLVSKADFYKMLKNSNENIVNELASVGFSVSPEHQKAIQDKRKKRNNPIELRP